MTVLLFVLQNFDRYHCCHLVLDMLCLFDEASVVQMSIAICGILAAKVSLGLGISRCSNKQDVPEIVKEGTEAVYITLLRRTSASSP